MILWFEKNAKITLIILLLTAAAIFFVSSMQFGPGTSGEGANINATPYHIFAFFLLALFLNIYLIRGRNRAMFIPAVLGAFLYAVFDEIHQYFVPGRNMSVFDVFLDSSGIILALILYYASLELRGVSQSL